jgi:hypothetical protein
VKESSTLGAICIFGTALESDAALRLEKAAAMSNAPAISDLLNIMAQAHRKRQRQLERIGRGNVTEMILEPLSGFYEEGRQLDPVDTVEQSAVLEEKMQGFYLAAAAKVTIPRVARQFSTLAEENAAMAGQIMCAGS